MHRERIIPDLSLERFVRGELTGSEKEEIAAAAAESPEIARRIEEIRRSDQEIIETYGADRIVAGIEARRLLREKSASRGRFVVWGFAATASTALFFLFFVNFFSGMEAERVRSDSPEVIRLKGETALLVHRLEGTESHRLEAGAVAVRGDRLQLGWRSADGEYGLLFSLDGAGNTTLHFPERADSEEKINKNGSFLLQRSYVLDNAPHFERFFFITADRPIDIAATILRATTLKNPEHDPLSLSSGFRQHSFLIRKAEGVPR